MRRVMILSASLAISAIGLPAAAGASLHLLITGTDTAGSSTSNQTYGDRPAGQADLSGEPFTLSITIQNYQSDPYISAFSVNVGNPHGPYITMASAFSSEHQYDGIDGVFSANATGGSFQFGSGTDYETRSDATFLVFATFQFETPEDLSSSFSTSASGSGGASLRQEDLEQSFSAGLNITSVQGFTSAPEPSTWAMMIAGFGLAGVGVRRRGPRATA